MFPFKRKRIRWDVLHTAPKKPLPSVPARTGTIFSENELRAAFFALLNVAVRDAVAGKDVSKTLSSSIGSNFRLILVPNNDPKFMDAISDTINGGAR